MKKNFIFKALTLLILALVIQSCSVIKTNDFAQRKYTKFKKGNDQVQLATNKVDQPVKSHETTIVQNQVSAESHESPAIASISTENQFSEPVQLIKKKSNFITANHAKSIMAKSAVKFAKRVASDFKGNKNTTSVSGDDQLLLLLIAILLPPLAVYLVAGIGTEFWIDILLCLLFWLPGIIYAIIIVMR